MAARWSSESVVAEHRELQANAMALDWQGEYTLLAGRRALALIRLENPSEVVKKVSRTQQKYDVTATEWNPTQSQGHTFVLAFGERAEICQWSESSVNSISSLCAHTRTITDLNWHRIDPHLLATCSIDTFVHIWDTREARKPISSLSSIAGASQVKWNKLNHHLLASGHDCDVRVWDNRKTSQPVQFISAHLSKIQGLDWSPNHENNLVTSSNDCTVRFFDITNPRKSANAINTVSPVWRVRYTPFGEGVVTVVAPQLRRGENPLLLWAVRDETTPVHTFVGHSDVVLEFEWRQNAPGEHQLVSWARDHSLRIWRVDQHLQRVCGEEAGLGESTDAEFTTEVATLVPDESECEGDAPGEEHEISNQSGENDDDGDNEDKSDDTKQDTDGGEGKSVEKEQQQSTSEINKPTTTADDGNVTITTTTTATTTTATTTTTTTTTTTDTSTTIATATTTTAATDANSTATDVSKGEKNTSVTSGQPMSLQQEFSLLNTSLDSSHINSVEVMAEGRSKEDQKQQEEEEPCVVMEVGQQQDQETVRTKKRKECKSDREMVELGSDVEVKVEEDEVELEVEMHTENDKGTSVGVLGITGKEGSVKENTNTKNDDARKEVEEAETTDEDAQVKEVVEVPGKEGSEKGDTNTGNKCVLKKGEKGITDKDVVRKAIEEETNDKDRVLKTGEGREEVKDAGAKGTVERAAEVETAIEGDVTLASEGKTKESSVQRKRREEVGTEEKGDHEQMETVLEIDGNDIQEIVVEDEDSVNVGEDVIIENEATRETPEQEEVVVECDMVETVIQVKENSAATYKNKKRSLKRKVCGNSDEGGGGGGGGDDVWEDVDSRNTNQGKRQALGSHGVSVGNDGTDNNSGFIKIQCSANDDSYEDDREYKTLCIHEADTPTKISIRSSESNSDRRQELSQSSQGEAPSVSLTLGLEDSQLKDQEVIHVECDAGDNMVDEQRVKEENIAVCQVVTSGSFVIKGAASSLMQVEASVVHLPESLTKGGQLPEEVWGSLAPQLLEGGVIVHGENLVLGALSLVTMVEAVEVDGDQQTQITISPLAESVESYHQRGVNFILVTKNFESSSAGTRGLSRNKRKSVGSMKEKPPQQKKVTPQTPRIFSCDKCDKTYKVRSSLTSHKTKHKIEKLYKCDECDRSFHYSTPLMIHKRTHSDERPYSCDECDAKFKSVTNLKCHQRQHKGEKPVPCPDCSRTFRDHTSLKRHRQRMHEAAQLNDTNTTTTTTTTITTDGSGGDTPQQDEVVIKVEPGDITNTDDDDNDGDDDDDDDNNPVVIKVEKNKNVGRLSDYVHKCGLCQMTCHTRPQMLTHLQIHAAAERYRCRYCSSAYTFRFVLAEHVRDAHPGSPQWFCQHCDRIFDSCRKMNSHSCRSVRGNYKCPHKCGFTTEVRHRIFRHVARNHPEDITPYHCDFCTKSYNEPGKLRYHQKRHHPEKMADLAPPPKDTWRALDEKGAEDKGAIDMSQVEVSVVDGVLEYYLPEDLRDDSAFNERVRFKCFYCEAKFPVKNAMTRHVLRTHPGQRAYKCLKCNVFFRSNIESKNHNRKYHKYKNSGGRDPERNKKAMKKRAQAVEEQLRNATPNIKSAYKYKCIYCPMAYRWRSPLVMHYKRWHPDMDLDHLPEGTLDPISPPQSLKRRKLVFFDCVFDEECGSTFDDCSMCLEHLLHAHEVKGAEALSHIKERTVMEGVRRGRLPKNAVAVVSGDKGPTKENKVKKRRHWRKGMKKVKSETEEETTLEEDSMETDYLDEEDLGEVELMEEEEDTKNSKELLKVIRETRIIDEEESLGDVKKMLYRCRMCGKSCSTKAQYKRHTASHTLDKKGTIRKIPVLGRDKKMALMCQPEEGIRVTSLKEELSDGEDDVKVLTLTSSLSGSPVVKVEDRKSKSTPSPPPPTPPASPPPTETISSPPSATKKKTAPAQTDTTSTPTKPETPSSSSSTPKQSKQKITQLASPQPHAHSKSSPSPPSSPERPPPSSPPSSPSPKATRRKPGPPSSPSPKATRRKPGPASRTIKTVKRKGQTPKKTPKKTKQLKAVKGKTTEKKTATPKATIAKPQETKGKGQSRTPLSNKLRCTDCSMSFKTRSELSFHRRLDH